MTEQIETYLREQFAADAERAPLARDLAGAARAQVRRHRRRTASVLGVGLAAFALAAGVVYGVNGQPRAAAPPAGDDTAVDLAVLAFRGVEVTVPEEMLVPRSEPCPRLLDRDVAYVENGDESVSECYGLQERNHPARLTQVVLQPWDLPAAFPAPPSGQRVLDDGRTQAVQHIASRDVRLIVTSPDPERAHRFLDGVRLADRPAGCALRDTADRPLRVATEPGPVVPSGARSGSVCSYGDGWLDQSHQLAPDEAAEVAEILNAAPEGLGAQGPNCPGGYDYLDGFREPHWLVRLAGGTEPTDVWVYAGDCLPSGAINGSGRAVRLTENLVDLLRRLAPGPTTVHGVETAPSAGPSANSPEEDLRARARDALESGRGHTVPIDGVAARFLAFARGDAEGIPADTPVKLYLGNRYEKTIAGADLSDRREWETTCVSDAPDSCRPVSALSVLRDLKQTPAITADLPKTCLVRLADQPTDTGGYPVGVLTHPAPTTCADQFAVQLWANDVGQITAVNLLLGRP